MKPPLDPTDAVEILDSLATHLTVAVRALRNMRDHLSSRPIEHRIREKAEIAVDQVFVSSILLTLSKFLEFHRTYQTLLPDNSPATMHAKQIHRTLCIRGLHEFRNKYVGHIWDKKRNRPLRQTEIQDALTSILGDDRDGFIEWVHNDVSNQFPSSIVSVIAQLRDDLARSHKVNPDEVHTR
jgi:hypothetical protein